MRTRSANPGRHRAPHPDAVFSGLLTEAQARSQRCLRDLVAKSTPGSIRVGHVEALAALFDEWAHDHAERQDGALFFTARAELGCGMFCKGYARSTIQGDGTASELPWG